MNKAFRLLIFIIFPLTGFSQNTDSLKWNRFRNLYDNPYRTFTPGKILSISGSAMLSTKKISNDFIYPFLFGSRLQKKNIDNTLDRSGNKKLGFESNVDVSYIDLDKSLFKLKNLHPYFKAGNDNSAESTVTNDAMRLIFKGNSDTSKYSFDNSEYYNLRFSKIGGGIYYHSDKSTRPYNLTFGVFILQGLNYGYIKTGENNYFQGNEDSFHLGLNYEAVFASTGSFTGNGLGAGAEIIFNQALNKKSNWGFRVENFGFVNFRKKATTYSSVGNYRFDGLFIPDISRLGEDGYFKHQLDSFTDPLTNKKEKQNKNILIAPATLIYYTIHLQGGYYRVALRHNGIQALPVAEIRYFNFIRPSLLFGASVGSIGDYYVNADLNWAITQRWFFQFGIYHLEALAAYRKLGGLGGNAGLWFVF